MDHKQKKKHDYKTVDIGVSPFVKVDDDDEDAEVKEAEIFCRNCNGNYYYYFIYYYNNSYGYV